MRPEGPRLESLLAPSSALFGLCGPAAQEKWLSGQKTQGFRTKVRNAQELGTFIARCLPKGPTEGARLFRPCALLFTRVQKVYYFSPCDNFPAVFPEVGKMSPRRLNFNIFRPWHQK